MLPSSLMNLSRFAGEREGPRPVDGLSISVKAGNDGAV